MNMSKNESFDKPGRLFKLTISMIFQIQGQRTCTWRWKMCVAKIRGRQCIYLCFPVVMHLKYYCLVISLNFQVLFEK